jgi:hypothetical protein
MNTAKKIDNTEFKTQNPDDPNVRDPEHAHELGGTLGMTVGGVAGGIAVGAAAAATAGAVLGGMAGPIGAVAGAAIGGALGGSAGEKIAREANPTTQEEYWERHYHTRPYIKSGHDFESYRPAYRVGIDSYHSNPAEKFDNLEPSLRNNWNIKNKDSKLEWDDARHAARDAFERLADSK